MKHCPACKSDSIDKTYSIGLRVLGCILLLFIPFGLFFCWIPFVLPHTYHCNKCGRNGNENELIDIDWREKELMMKEIKILEEKLSPIINKWYYTSGGYLYKVVGDNTQSLLLEFSGDCLKPYVIVDYIVETIPSKLFIKDQIKSHYMNSINNSPYIEGFITEEETTRYEDGNTEAFIAWLKENNKIITPIDYKIV